MAVSVRDVARQAGVSVGTVSNVLNRPSVVAQDTATRVHDAIANLGFVRNEAARQLRAGSSLCIGLLVLDIRNPFFADVAQGAEEAAAERGLAVLLADSGSSAVREQTLLEMFETQRVRGLLISPVASVCGTEEPFERLRANGIPAVLVDRASAGGALPSVSVDDVQGGRLAVRHLAAIGRRRVLFVGGPLELAQVANRLEGAREAAAESDIVLEVLPTKALTVAQGVQVGEQLRTSHQDVDAIFAANDLVALGVLQGIGLQSGTRVPQDLAIVGYDDIEFAAAAAVPMSSVHQPGKAMGRHAVEMLLAEIDGTLGERQMVLQPHLVIRRSTQE